MKITVELVAHLQNEKFHKKEIAVDDNTSAEDIFNLLGFKNKDNFVMILNGKHTDFDCILKEGDNLVFMPFVDGG